MGDFYSNLIFDILRWSTVGRKTKTKTRQSAESEKQLERQRINVVACGMESSGRKEVLDKEETGQEVELVELVQDKLAGAQKCCRGEQRGLNRAVRMLRIFKK